MFCAVDLLRVHRRLDYKNSKRHDPLFFSGHYHISTYHKTERSKTCDQEGGDTVRLTVPKSLLRSARPAVTKVCTTIEVLLLSATSDFRRSYYFRMYWRAPSVRCHGSHSWIRCGQLTLGRVLFGRYMYIRPSHYEVR